MRIRHQDGWVEERGSRVKRWYGHYYRYLIDESGKETRVHVGVQLGEKSKMRKFEAADKLRKIITSVTKAQPKPSEQTLVWFVRERFLPMRHAQWAPSLRGKRIFITWSSTFCQSSGVKRFAKLKNSIARSF